MIDAEMVRVSFNRIDVCGCYVQVILTEPTIGRQYKRAVLMQKQVEADGVRSTSKDKRSSAVQIRERFEGGLAEAAVAACESMPEPLHTRRYWGGEDVGDWYVRSTKWFPPWLKVRPHELPKLNWKKFLLVLSPGPIIDDGKVVGRLNNPQTLRIMGWIAGHDVPKHSMWTNFGHDNRPMCWAVPTSKLHEYQVS